MATQKKTDWRIVCFGIACVTALEFGAMYNGINGMMLTTVIAVIAAAVGVTISNPLKTK